MNLTKMLLTLAIILVIGVGITTVIYSQSQIVNVQEFHLFGKVDDSFGLGFNGSQILFHVRPGEIAFRPFFIRNNFSFDVSVNFQVEGNISGLISVPERVFVASGKNMNSSVDFIPPIGTKYGRYTGTLRAIFKRAKNYK
jgi:hypothetical protein